MGVQLARSYWAQPISACTPLTDDADCNAAHDAHFTWRIIRSRSIFHITCRLLTQAHKWEKQYGQSE